MKDYPYHGSEDYPPPVSAVPAEGDEKLEALWDNHIPPWNDFDTFLRRSLMGGGALLIWAALITALVIFIKVVIFGE